MYFNGKFSDLMEVMNWVWRFQEKTGHDRSRVHIYAEGQRASFQIEGKEGADSFRSFAFNVGFHFVESETSKPEVVTWV